MGRARQHADVGAGAEHPVLARTHHHDLHVGMLEAQPLHGVGQFDVDAEIVGIQLELIALEQAAILVDVHGQGRDVAVDGELPVPVARWIGLEIDVLRAAREHPIFIGHGPFPVLGLFVICTIMHVLDSSSQKQENMHFVSCSAAGRMQPRLAGSGGALFRALVHLHDRAIAIPRSPAASASGASRCGEWPAPGIMVTSTGQ